MDVHQQVATNRGGPEVLRWQAFEPTAPGPGQLGVRVEASGVLLADVMHQRGLLPFGPTPPFTPGHDLAGIVVQLGPDVTDFEVGQRVAAFVQHGGYTEYALIDAARAVPVPEDVKPHKAAAAATSYLAAYKLLNGSQRLPEKSVVLVHGAGGGTGSALIDVGTHLGYKMYGTCSAGKAGVVAKKGGTPLYYRNEDFSVVMRIKEKPGVDLVIDTIGGNVTTRSLKLLKPRGRLVSLAIIQDLKRDEGLPVSVQRMRLPAWSLVNPGKHAASWDLATEVNKDLAAYRRELAAVLDLVQQKALKPMVGLELPFRDAREAQRQLLNFQVRGKAVLRAD